MRVVYLDNNATTRTAPEVVEAMLPYFTDLYGNPSSMHSFGGQLAKPVEQAREQVAVLIQADPAEIVFTSCGTESDNAAIWGTLNSFPQKNHIITTRVEHPAVGNLATYLSKKGYKVTSLPVDREGRLDPAELLVEQVRVAARPGGAAGRRGQVQLPGANLAGGDRLLLLQAHRRGRPW